MSPFRSAALVLGLVSLGRGACKGEAQATCLVDVYSGWVTARLAKGQPCKAAIEVVRVQGGEDSSAVTR